MAEASEIQVVVEKLSKDAATNGWTSERIGTDLDAGLSANQIALNWWSFWLANCVNLVDVSESGSSRSLSQIFAHAQAMVSSYQALVNQENPPTTETSFLRSYQMNRV